MTDTELPRGYLNQQQVIERIERLEHAVLLLAQHVGAVGWNHALQQALDQIREVTW